MNGYLLAITVFVVTAGRLGDMFGRKRLFLIGDGGLRPRLGRLRRRRRRADLIFGRVLQGVGAAPMLPLSLAIVCNAFPKEEQARALGIWAGISAVALAIGPLAGGALVEVDWRVIFWINLPVAGDRDRDHGLRGARVDRPRLRPPGRLPRPAHPQRRPHRARPRPRPGAGLERRGDDRARRRSGSPRSTASGGSSTGPRSRSSTSRCSATGPTSAPAPPPSPSSAPTGA